MLYFLQFLKFDDFSSHFHHFGRNPTLQIQKGLYICHIKFEWYQAYQPIFSLRLTMYGYFLAYIMQTARNPIFIVVEI